MEYRKVTEQDIDNMLGATDIVSEEKCRAASGIMNAFLSDHKQLPNSDPYFYVDLVTEGSTAFDFVQMALLDIESGRFSRDPLSTIYMLANADLWVREAKIEDYDVIDTVDTILRRVDPESGFDSKWKETLRDLFDKYASLPEDERNPLTLQNLLQSQ